MKRAETLLDEVHSHLEEAAELLKAASFYAEAMQVEEVLISVAIQLPADFAPAEQPDPRP